MINMESTETGATMEKIKDLRTQMGKKTFVCNLCNQIFSYKCTLKRHTETKHFGEKPFQCTQCDKCFNSKYAIDVHSRIHTGDKPYACSICDKAFAQKINLRKHFMALHEEHTKVSCSLCGRSFKLKEHLNRHMIRIHELAAPEKKPFECLVCGKRFIKQSDLGRHNRLTHIKKQNCFLCNQEFGFDPYQKVPFVKFNHKKLYACSNCEKMIFECMKCKEMFQLRTRTVKEHDDKKNRLVLECSLCLKQFCEIEELKQHCLMHMTQNLFECMQCLWYSCSECGLQFTDKSEYQEHCNSHSRLLHECRACGEKFASVEEMKQHSLAHVKTEVDCDDAAENEVWLPESKAGIKLETSGTDKTVSEDDDHSPENASTS